jgi:uncharacterized protein (UPF0333 family)
MLQKKAQAAMEFLMTYGWALLVVLAAIGALAYFGVLKPQQFLPEQCVLVPGVACSDFKVNSSQTVMVILNSLGRDMSITRISAGNCSKDFNYELKNGEQFEFILTGCNNGESGGRFKSDIVVDYVSKDSGLSKTIKGSISAKIQ